MERLAKGWGGILTLQIRNSDGDLVDATGSVNVTVKDDAGATVATGTATKTPSKTGIYTFACTPAQLANLGVYTATWSATVSGISITPTTQADVVGFHLFGIDELRAKQSILSDTTKYPSTVLATRRAEATEWLEEIMGVALTPRRTRLVGKGDNTDRLLTRIPMISQIVSATVDGETWNVADIAGRHDLGVLTAPAGHVWSGDITLVLEHGYPVLHEKIKAAALTVAVEASIPSGLNPRATVQNTDLGAFRLSIPAPGTPTGIPEVDMVVHEYGFRRPGV